jgi:hypothetical protein
MYKTTYAKLPKELIESILYYNFNIWYNKLKDIQYEFDDKKYYIVPQDVISIQIHLNEMKEIEKLYENNIVDSYEENVELKELIETIKSLIKNDKSNNEDGW